MSTITTYPLNGVDYDAADVAAYESTRTSGVYSADEDFAVTAAGGLDVTVGAGRAWVHPSRFAGYSITKREPETVTLPLADGTRPRIDRILLRYDAAARKTSLLILTGDPASTPTAPAITRTELIYDLCLAEISRPAGSTEVTTGQITDTRLDESLCGVMSDGVTGLPTAQLLSEARARIAEVEETASDSAAAADKSQRAAAQNQQDAEAARDAAAGSARAAGTSETNAGQSAEKAATSESNAKESETKSKASEEAAAKSEAAAAKNETAAKASKEAAEKSAELAGTRAGTDKTLSVENAPADAAVVGRYILDRTKDTPELVFYSKAETDAKIKEILAAQREEDYKRVRYWVSDDPTSPASFIGGTWEQIKDKFILAAGDTYAAGSTGGEESVKLVNANIPASWPAIGTSLQYSNALDTHVSKWGYYVQAYAVTDDNGRWCTGLFFQIGEQNNTAVNNMPPYITKYVWQRIE